MQIISNARRQRFEQRLKRDKAKHNKALRVVTFAQELNLAGVRAKVKVKSIILQLGVSTREARLAIKLTKRKKPRRRRSTGLLRS